MPRATQSAGSSVVDFFRKSPLELADFVMGLCKDALRERHQKSADAKARAVPAKAAPKAAVKAKTAAPKKKAKKRQAKRTAGLPAPGSAQDTVGPMVPASTQNEPVGASV